VDDCAAGRARRLRHRDELRQLGARLRRDPFDEAGLSNWERYVETDQALVRPAEVDHLIGDYSKAERELGWRPKTSFEQLIRLMTRSDLELLGR
jgi:GDP-D-mannose dehydratase